MIYLLNLTVSDYFSVEFALTFKIAASDSDKIYN